MKAALVRAYGLLVTQIGIDPLRFVRACRGVPRYLSDLARFRRSYRGPLSLSPSLQDWYDEAGATRTEYFWQDLLVARWIAEARPERHVDVGSRIDGFVAHVASFREIEVLDVRPMTSAIPGVRFRQADLMNPVSDLVEYCDSLSCLHALEHFGLGRYGDPLDPQGFERGMASLTRLLRAGGTFYLSVPVGRARVEFNSHRVLDAAAVIALARRNGCELRRLVVIERGSRVVEKPITDASVRLDAADALGIFTFAKVGQPR